MPQATIHVLSRQYQASIENGLLQRAGSVLGELLPQVSRMFVVTVSPVRKRWGSKLVKSLKASGFAPQVITMPDGEPAKRLATVEAMAEKLARLGADRKALIIALGGGVVGDVSGLQRRYTCVESSSFRSRLRCSLKWTPPSAAKPA